jgi:hypothetical protein
MIRLRTQIPLDLNFAMRNTNKSPSADATIAAQATGAMSWAFITAIKQNSNQSYVELLNSIREVLQSKYTQKPQLSCSHPLGEQTIFHMHNLNANLSQIPIFYSSCSSIHNVVSCGWVSP